MNKKKKNGFKGLMIFLVLLVTLFTGTMVACGLFKEKNQEKTGEDEAAAAEEEVYSGEEVPDLGSENIAVAAQDEASLNFDLDELPETIEPGGLCVYGDALYVTDASSGCIWKVTESDVESIAGEDSGLELPWGVAAFGDGIAVSDTDGGAVYSVVDGDASSIKNSDGDAGSYEFPTGITSDENGNLYVADTHANDVTVISPDGESNTFIEGLNCPMGLCYNGGYLYIAETGNNRIVRIAVTDTSTKSSSDIEVVAGSGIEGDLDGEAPVASFSSPKGITVGSDGTVYVADTVNGAVRMIKNGQVTTCEVKDDRIPEAELVSPVGMCIQG